MATVFLILYVMCAVVAVAMAGYAALSDVRSMQIPNICSLLVIILFLGAYAVSAFAGVDVMSDWRSHLVAAAIMLVATGAMYAVKSLGAGDSKLATAFALWAGLKGLYAFIFFMTIAGGILGLVALVLRGRSVVSNPRPGSWLAVLQGGRGALPYGVAIFCGALAMFIERDFLSPETFRAFLTPQS